MKKPTQSIRVIIRKCVAKGVTVGCAESCTGGLIAKLLTDVSGSSAVFRGGFVTYTNEIKEALLGVDPALIAEHTEVSYACAEAMADGARHRLGTGVAVSTTGYAGPGGGTKEDPVGTVYVAISTPEGTHCDRLSLPRGLSRAQTRMAAARHAIALLENYVDQL